MNRHRDEGRNRIGTIRLYYRDQINLPELVSIVVVTLIKSVLQYDNVGHNVAQFYCPVSIFYPAVLLFTGVRCIFALSTRIPTTL